MDARTCWKAITRPISGEESTLDPTSSTLCIRDITRHEVRWSYRRSGCTLNFRQTVTQVKPLIRIGLVAMMAGALFACHATGQATSSFSSVKKLYVESFGDARQDD